MSFECWIFAIFFHGLTLVSGHLISSHLISSRLISAIVNSSHLIQCHLMSSHLMSHLIFSFPSPSCYVMSSPLFSQLAILCNFCCVSHSISFPSNQTPQQLFPCGQEKFSWTLVACAVRNNARSQSLAATSAVNPAIENPMQVVDGAIGCEPSHASTVYLQDCHKQLAAAYLWQGKMLKH